MAVKLTKYDELECFGHALVIAFGTGARMPIKTMRKAVANVLGLVAEKSYHNKMHELHDIFGSVIIHKDICIEVGERPS